MSAEFLLRAYRADDEEAAIALWHATWQQVYPAIDFDARLAWWRARWRNELVPHASIVVAERDGEIAGFVTIDASGYLDQLVVAASRWGSPLATALVDEAKRLSPQIITLKVNADNVRAIRFYERNGFAHNGDEVNEHSGRGVRWMEWNPAFRQAKIAVD